MKRGRVITRIVLAASVAAMAACSCAPLLTRPFGSATNAPLAALSLCDPNPVFLCLISFGLQPPDQMLIGLFVPSGLPRDFLVKVTHDGRETAYGCLTAANVPTTVYCTGPQLPLGTSISIEIHAARGNAVLARGEFVLNALALPTLTVGGTPTPMGTTPQSAPATPILESNFPRA